MLRHEYNHTLQIEQVRKTHSSRSVLNFRFLNLILIQRNNFMYNLKTIWKLTFILRYLFF